MAKQFLLLFSGTFFISLFVLMMQFLWRYVDELIGKGLSLEVLAEFFWYMGLMLVPQALPLAVLLASLITMGNIGENSELTAIKAAGISLMQALRSLIACTIVIAGISYYFQNYIGPQANLNMSQLLVSMKQKSPELEIPEGVFYDGIPNSNIYVQKKNLETGKLYGIMIYRINNSYEDAAIILADSGMLQSTADKKHLLLTLHSGEWFENMRSQEGLTQNTNVPYRRETFISKRIILDFDNGFNLADGAMFSSNAKAKSLEMIVRDLDSIHIVYDSIGLAVKTRVEAAYLHRAVLGKDDSLRAVKMAMAETMNYDTLFAKLTREDKLVAMQRGYSAMRMAINDLEFQKEYSVSMGRTMREHWIEAVNKFTLALTCLIFFFIGAPLGAIIRKGGLGVPVIIAVLVFIVFYILDNTGFRMSRIGAWPVWLGKGLAPFVLTPLALFVTYKANKDSSVFNMDMYRTFFMRLLGMRLKRSVMMKEVVIEDPDYAGDALALQQITDDIVAYASAHKLMHAPNIINVFFKYQPDHEIRRVSQQLELVIQDLGNSRDRFVIDYINRYPVVSEKAHTRPFERRWLNIASICLLPLGVFLYFRMWRFRLRLLHDLRQIRQTNELMIKRIEEIG